MPIIILIFKIQTTRQYLIDYIDEIQLGLIVSLAVMGIYSDLFIGELGIYLFLFILGGTVFVIAYSGLSKKRYSELQRLSNQQEEKIKQLEFQLNDDILHKREEVKHYIINLAENRLEFCYQEKYEDRITLYLHLDELNAFMLFYRFSKNPELQKTGRRTYPDSIGVIQEAWQHGKASRSYNHRYDEDPEGYIKELYEKDGLERELVINLTMHPQQVIACRLDKGQDLFYGLLVIESNKKGRFNDDEVYRIINTCGHSKGEVYSKVGELKTLYRDLMESSEEMGLDYEN
ncbi:hypothetical protein FTO68_01970 [Methanocalculus taiwanensis]|uniref:GAF domain-containing protein n=1 Tax=Methanocalculus taiwanensis TaxID=106207 RepID=A0ABD4TIV1_9EURY|nr:hypothetical protein [Methanocalculus taiwanensis]MCQ1537760.1 hypothetical protein [Methanocalculus taiwanensis]